MIYGWNTRSYGKFRVGLTIENNYNEGPLLTSTSQSLIRHVLVEVSLSTPLTARKPLPSTSAAYHICRHVQKGCLSCIRPLRPPHVLYIE